MIKITNVIYKGILVLHKRLTPTHTPAHFSVLWGPALNTDLGPRKLLIRPCIQLVIKGQCPR
jgi:hypothetical protein